MPAARLTIRLIAGCNGAGRRFAVADKTTFAKEFLPCEVKCLRFYNADELARGLSPLDPPAAAIKAGRMLLTEIRESIRRKESFALESTISGKHTCVSCERRRDAASASTSIIFGYPRPLSRSPAFVSA